MSDDVERSKRGQFKPGQSGNPAGARRRANIGVPSPRELHRIILWVTGSETEMTINNKKQKMSVFEMNVWRSASGAPSSRLAAKDFIELAKSSAYWMDREIKREDERRRKEEREW